MPKGFTKALALQCSDGLTKWQRLHHCAPETCPMDSAIIFASRNLYVVGVPLGPRNPTRLGYICLKATNNHQIPVMSATGTNRTNPCQLHFAGKPGSPPNTTCTNHCIAFAQAKCCLPTVYIPRLWARCFVPKGKFLIAPGFQRCAIVKDSFG